LEAQLLEVMVIFTILGVVEGVLVILKLLIAVFTSGKVCVKKFAPPASGPAVTSIVTPAEGRLAVIFTCSGKLGPGAAGSVLPLAGVVVTCKAVSLQLLFPPPPPFLHEEIVARKNRVVRLNNTIFFMLQ